MQEHDSTHPGTCPVLARDGADAGAVARRWGLPIADAGTPPGLRLVVDRAGLALADTRPGRPGPLRVDWQDPALLRRLQRAGATHEPLARAAGARRGRRPVVIDATAGLGTDAAVLAAIGCPVTLVEAAPVVAALLDDGVRRAAIDYRLAGLCARLTLHHGDALALLRGGALSASPEVVYLDPMYPERRGSAKSGSAMQHLQALLPGGDGDGAALLDAALQVATHRVVVKRPRRAPPLDGPPVDSTEGGRSTRFDCYLCNTGHRRRDRAGGGPVSAP